MDAGIKKLYLKEDYNRNFSPYNLYLSALEDVFNFSLASSFADLGCNNGQLIYAVKLRYSNLKVWGCDYFSWSKIYANDLIKDKIEICDLSKPLLNNHKFDIVNCSEVGEHISMEGEDALIDNLIRLTNDVLILTWSNQIQEQHLNPRPQSYIIKKLHDKGLNFWDSATEDLKKGLRERELAGAFHWWADNVMVFKKVKYLDIDSTYFIQGTYTDNETHKVAFKKKSDHKFSLQSSFLKLILKIKGAVAAKKSFSVLRASDGDFYFLEAISVGSASPGKRALTKKYSYSFLNPFRSLFWKNDLVTFEVEPSFRYMWIDYCFLQILFYCFRKLNVSLQSRFRLLIWNFFRALRPVFTWVKLRYLTQYFFVDYFGLNYKYHTDKLFRNEYISSESVYALVSTKWIFREYPNEIGLLGNSVKVALIKELMQRPAYRDYLGVNSFTDYIGVPQIGAADELYELASLLGNQILQSKAKIFLVGVGSVKVGLLPLLKAYTDAIFIDVGCGIDAMAGVVCQDRPYFADWTNFRIENYCYEVVDFMDQGNPKWSKSSYKTIFLD
jgi:2-polyprenyl-3-methyl-5-hydroxy-6-metoxy-1,4-benzoquinol methylase